MSGRGGEPLRNYAKKCGADAGGLGVESRFISTPYPPPGPLVASRMGARMGRSVEPMHGLSHFPS